MKKYLVSSALAGVMMTDAANAYDGVIYAGGVIGEDASGYAGVTKALPGGSLGKGLAFKFAASGGKYRYDNGLTDINARYYGAHIGLVYQKSGPWGWANIAAGPRFTYTDLTPADPSNERAGARWDAIVAIDGALTPQSFRIQWYAETGFRDRSYLAKVQATRAVNDSGWRAGVEGIIQGDRQYDKQGIGAVIAKRISEKFEVQASGGVAFQQGRDNEPYVSISFSKLF